ncbi:MAG: hypothetical protein WDM90_08305 [Ferruginibacter sp.]
MSFIKTVIIGKWNRYNVYEDSPKSIKILGIFILTFISYFTIPRIINVEGNPKNNTLSKELEKIVVSPLLLQIPEVKKSKPPETIKGIANFKGIFKTITEHKTPAKNSTFNGLVIIIFHVFKFSKECPLKGIKKSTIV